MVNASMRVRRQIGRDIEETIESIGVRLWDCIDQSWSGPFPQEFAHTHYLRKVVLKCSACKFTTAFERGVDTHVEQIRHHERVTLIPQSGGERAVCSGCPPRVQSMPLALAEKHLREIQLSIADHAYVEEQAIKRFALEPSEPVVLHKRVIAGGTAGPSSRAVEGRQRKRKRSRNRRRAYDH